MPVVKRRYAHDPLFHTFDIGMFKMQSYGYTKIKLIYNESVNSIEIYDVIYFCVLFGWNWEMDGIFNFYQIRLAWNNICLWHAATATLLILCHKDTSDPFKQTYFCTPLF